MQDAASTEICATVQQNLHNIPARRSNVKRHATLPRAKWKMWTAVTPVYRRPSSDTSAQRSIIVSASTSWTNRTSTSPIRLRSLLAFVMAVSWWTCLRPALTYLGYLLTESRQVFGTLSQKSVKVSVCSFSLLSLRCRYVIRLR